jgi:peptidoglycan DL-endopeptidase CwlO
VRVGLHRLRAGLWISVAAGTVAAGAIAAVSPHLPSSPVGRATHQTVSHAAGHTTATRQPGHALPARTRDGDNASIREYQAMVAAVGHTPADRGNAVTEATAARQLAGQSAVSAEQSAGVFLPAGARAATDAATEAVPVARLSGLPAGHSIGALGKLEQADLLIVSAATLPPATITRIRKVAGVRAASLLDAARISINGQQTATLGVDPATFRRFAAKPTAQSQALWQNVADGGIAISYLMGKQEKLPLGGQVTAAGATTQQLKVAGFGTVGIGGVDAVVSDTVARELGMPAGNAIVISAPGARLSRLMSKLTRLLPKTASIAPLVSQAPERGLPVTGGSAGAVGVTASDGPGLTAAQTRAFLTAALAQVGKPYVWGGDGPNVFDCSGLVQWSMRQAGIVMPRVASDQAQTGPRIPLSELAAGDLLFYHTDPTAPQYISHVAIYLGDGLMLQAPEPGMDVEVVPAIFTGGFAGAVRVYPRVAAYVAGDLAG